MSPYLKRALSAAALATALAPVPAHAVTTSTVFDIVLDYTGTWTTSQQSIFESAANVWEYLITGYQDSTAYSFSSVVISAASNYIDGVGSILGQAGPTRGAVSLTGNYFYVTEGEMEFDSADLANMESNGSLFAVILHEMAHVLGIGTLWSMSEYGLPGQNVYDYGTDYYYGSYALAAYQTYCDASATYVPVETDGSTGTAYGHWDEDWACGDNELMTGWLDTPVELSYVTVASFADIGYTVVGALPAVPLPGGLVLAASALGALGALRRRKARA